MRILLVVSALPRQRAVIRIARPAPVWRKKKKKAWFAPRHPRPERRESEQGGPPSQEFKVLFNLRGKKVKSAFSPQVMISKHVGTLHSVANAESSASLLLTA